MLDKITFKVFGYSEAEIRDILSRAAIVPMLVEERGRDARVVFACETGRREEESLHVYKLFRGCVYSESDETLAQAVLDRLRFYQKTLSVAESLTGGLVTSALVEIPGCSECLQEGVVTYSNQAKVARLGVNPATLSTFGAVSSQVACQMASGLMRTGVNYAVATTGIAGPGGGSAEKPVGLVYIAVADEYKCQATECRFEGTREEIRLLAANTALFLLWKKVVKPIDFDNMVIE